MTGRLATFALALLVSRPAGAGGGAAAFLADGVGARWIGLGGAARAAADDVHAGAWNPAGLAALGPEVWQAGSMVVFQSLGRSTASLSGAWQTDAAGTWAATWVHRAVTGLERVDEGGVVTGTGTSAEDALLLSGAFAPGYRVRLGVTVRMLHQSLLGASASGAAADLGVQVQPFLAEELVLAATAESLGGTMRWTGGATDRPRPAVAAAAAWRGWRNRVLLAADLVARARPDETEVRAGAEVWPVASTAAVRAGWDGRFPAAGATYLWRPYQLDYAFTFDPDRLGTRHQVSFLLHF